jgi:hypothetical protein
MTPVMSAVIWAQRQPLNTAIMVSVRVSMLQNPSVPGSLKETGLGNYGANSPRNQWAKTKIFRAITLRT